MNAPTDAATTTSHQQVNDDDIKTHKEFLIQFINSLILRAQNEDSKHSVTRQATLVGEMEPVIHLDQTQQLRFSRTISLLLTFHHVQFLPVDNKLISRTQ